MAEGICQKHFLAWSVCYDQVILLQTEEHSLELCGGHCEIFQADHLEGLMVSFHDECPSVQICMEFFTTIYDPLRVLSWCWHSGSQCLWGICWQMLWAVLLEWCRLWAPWVMCHTGGWPVWSDHSISGVWGGLSATGTWFSGSRY